MQPKSMKRWRGGEERRGKGEERIGKERKGAKGKERREKVRKGEFGIDTAGGGGRFVWP